MPALIRDAVSSAALHVADVGKWLAIRYYPAFELAATTPIPGWAEPLGVRAALRAAFHARDRVPAYRAFLEESRWVDDRSLSGGERLARLPVSDKQSYVLRYSTAERCIDGRVPLVGTEMDESSGSSGKPFDWVRGAAELDEMHRQFSQYARYVFGDSLVTINGFSMGAWSTGVNTGQAMKRNGLVKSTGPDLDKIIHTLQVLGPDYTYVLTGYPPFLREVLEFGQRAGLEWRRYRLYGIVGGEAMSELLRDQLLSAFIAVYSAYGASDLDIGVAGESPISIWLRRQAAANPDLRRRLFGDDPRLPMVFQFNPLDHNVETVDGELVITVSRLSMLSPRIRYNIHDAGGSFTFGHAMAACHEIGIDLSALPALVSRRAIRLPFIFVHGRSDSTISYMGANIYPEDVEQALFADAKLDGRVGAFCLELRDVGSGAVRPCVHVEALHEGDEILGALIRRSVVARLEANSRDFKAAVAENPTTADILIELHRPGQGPFAENSRRIKRRYIVRG